MNNRFFRCERCGKFYRKNTIKDNLGNYITHVCFVDNKGLVVERRREVCDDCINDLNKAFEDAAVRLFNEDNEPINVVEEEKAEDEPEVTSAEGSI